MAAYRPLEASASSSCSWLSAGSTCMARYIKLHSCHRQGMATCMCGGPLLLVASCCGAVQARRRSLAAAYMLKSVTCTHA